MDVGYWGKREAEPTTDALAFHYGRYKGYRRGYRGYRGVKICYYGGYNYGGYRGKMEAEPTAEAVAFHYCKDISVDVEDTEAGKEATRVDTGH